MAVAKWNTPGTQGSNIASTTLDSLANGSASSRVTHDNSSTLDLYASVLVDLGSITPSSGGSITLVVTSAQSADVPDDIAAVGGGDRYTVPLTTSTGAKKVVFPMVRLYPESMRLQIVNNAGVSLASSANSIKVRPFNESVA